LLWLVGCNLNDLQNYFCASWLTWSRQLCIAQKIVFAFGPAKSKIEKKKEKKSFPILLFSWFGLNKFLSVFFS
jgi:hypothetical protein